MTETGRATPSVLRARSALALMIVLGPLPVARASHAQFLPVGATERRHAAARPHLRSPRHSFKSATPADLLELPRMTPDPPATSSDAAPSATAGRRFTVGPVTITPGGFLAGDGSMR